MNYKFQNKFPSYSHKKWVFFKISFVISKTLWAQRERFHKRRMGETKTKKTHKPCKLYNMYCVSPIHVLAMCSVHSLPPK